MVPVAAFLALAVLALPGSSAQSCIAAAPQTDFQPKDYTGVWYEIGKVQTFGGAIFESSCVCTQLIVVPTPGGKAGDSSVLNSCRDKTPAGAFINASASLVNMAPPGHWDETFLPPSFGVFVNYTVIFSGSSDMSGSPEEYSVEYDCSGDGLFNNYCIHILARKPTMSKELTAKLVADSLALGLNTQGLPFNATHQEGCW